MSTSLNSVQLQNSINSGNLGSIGSNSNLGSLQPSTISTVPPIMSTSLHSGNFESNNSVWSSSSSLSPTISAQRKCEVKLNAMP